MNITFSVKKSAYNDCEMCAEILFIISDVFRARLTTLLTPLCGW